MQPRLVGLLECLHVVWVNGHLPFAVNISSTQKHGLLCTKLTGKRLLSEVYLALAMKFLFSVTDDVLVSNPCKYISSKIAPLGIAGSDKMLFRLEE